VKDPFALLRHKEQEIARLRKEIRALLDVIPLLKDTSASWPEVRQQIETLMPAGEAHEETADDSGLLERYFPFISRRKV
jgi:hypothetical protein